MSWRSLLVLLDFHAMTEPAEIRQNSQYRLRSLVIAILLVAGVLIWVSVDLSRSRSNWQIRSPLPIGSAFDGNSILPVAEFKTKFDNGCQLLSSLEQTAKRWRLVTTISEWTAFLITSVVAIVAGRFGISAAPDEVGMAKVRDATAAAAAEQEKLDQPLRQAERRRRRVLQWIGVLAAFSSVVLALSAKSSATKDETVKSAMELSDGLSKSRKAWFDAKSPQEATLAIDDLEKAILKASQ
jgi:hypothetical protein